LCPFLALFAILSVSTASDSSFVFWTFLPFSAPSDAWLATDVGAAADANVAAEGGSAADGGGLGGRGLGGSSRLGAAERNAGERCAYRIVIFMDVWPRSSATERNEAPRIMSQEAKQCRRSCHVKSSIFASSSAAWKPFLMSITGVPAFGPPRCGK